MRKVLYLLVLLFPMLTMGQDVKFMGLEFGTDMNTFCKALEAKGLKQTVDRFDKREFVGTFATYNNCTIIIKSTEVSKKVRSAEVIFESVRNDEYERNKAFEEILKQYKSKYGNKVVKDSNRDSEELLGLVTYIIDCGDIKIHLNKTGPSLLSPEECSMSIYYYSKSLVEKKETNTKKYSDDI